MLVNYLFVGAGAGVGAVIRYAITNFGKKHWATNFPYATLLINLTGAFLLGILFKCNLEHPIYNLLGTGIMGGYTTFSTMNVELLDKTQDKQFGKFWLYLIISYAGGLLAVYLGYLI